MKSSHKFYAATGGLLIAALMGFSQSFADDQVTTPATPEKPIEMVTPANNASGSDKFNLEGVVDNKGEAAPEKDAAAAEDANKAAAAESTESAGKSVVPEKSAPESKDAETTEAVKDSEATKVEAEPAAKSTEAEKSTAESTPEAEEVTPADTEKSTEEATGESEKAELVEESDVPESKVTEEAKEEASVTAAATSEVKAAPVVPVTYVQARHSSVTSSADADEIVAPHPQAEAPLLTMAKTEEATPSSEKTPNGESVVVFFELPQPAGPALVPGQATPLLNSAVSEEATNANVVPATAVQQEAPVQQAATQKNVSRVSAGTTVTSESGTLSRSLARTGSIAQYAALLSAGALILGVAFVAGAIATSRRNSRLVDAE